MWMCFRSGYLCTPSACLRLRAVDLTKSYASKNVNPKLVSEMLGHSSVSITLNIYSHLLPDMQEKAIEALEELLS